MYAHWTIGTQQLQHHGQYSSIAGMHRNSPALACVVPAHQRGAALRAAFRGMTNADWTGPTYGKQEGAGKPASVRDSMASVRVATAQGLHAARSKGELTGGAPPPQARETLSVGPVPSTKHDPLAIGGFAFAKDNRELPADTDPSRMCAPPFSAQAHTMGSCIHIGGSRFSVRVHNTMSRVAPTNGCLLVSGPSGYRPANGDRPYAAKG